MSMRFCLTFLLLILISNFSIFGQNTKRIVDAVKINEVIKIDGKLTEDIWQINPPITDFTQYYPDNRGNPSSKTEAWLFYDDYGVYIGVKCYENNPDSISKGLGIRDGGLGTHSDGVVLIFSPYNDGVNFSYFLITAANVQTDVIFTGENSDDSWDAVWDSETSVDNDGWVCEVRIPYSALRFPKQEVQDWGFNLWRWISRKREWSSWNYVSNEINHWWKYPGEIKNFKNLNPPVRLSVTPYVSAYVEKETDKKEAYSYNLGMDLKYGLSQSFTLDMTLIPDFGQVQSDDIELNLSPFELYYNEKRQFFTEGMDLFKKAEIFYSRRIGSQPQAYNLVEGSLQVNEEVRKNPNETQLINSTKISGRTKSGLGIGMLNAMTQKSLAEIEDTISKQERNFQTQPFTNYNVAVIDKTLFSKSYISLINTNYFNTDYLANVLASEFNITDSESIYGIKGIVAYSYIKDENVSQGKKLSVEGGKIGGKIQAIYNLSIIDDEYNQNDLGFMRNNNEFNNDLSLYYKIMKPFSILLNLTNELYFGYKRLYSPNAYSEFLISYLIEAEFKNRYSFFMHAAWAPVEKHDYYETRVDGRYVEMNKWYHNCFSLNSDQSKSLSVRFHGGFTNSYDYFNDIKSYNLGIETGLKINNQLKINYDLYYYKSINKPGYIEPDFNTDIIYFGKRDQETVINTLNFSYIFTNKMSINLRLRHYWSKAEYDEFYELDNNGKLQSSTYAENHDINYNAFNIDMIYRWNFAPGSEFLINWKNSISSEDDIIIDNYWRNVDALFDYSKINSFSIKLLYYIDYHTIKSKRTK